ncbi:hypothetical protein LC593_11545 [Nostoc sp. CHAB 5844]|nr:hypothetical protein [Nostoc sp. CHAB 5844]
MRCFGSQSCSNWHCIVAQRNGLFCYLERCVSQRRGTAKMMHKYNSCGVGILPAPDGLEAHPTRKPNLVQKNVGWVDVRKPNINLGVGFR